MQASAPGCWTLARLSTGSHPSQALWREGGDPREDWGGLRTPRQGRRSVPAPDLGRPGGGGGGRVRAPGTRGNVACPLVSTLQMPGKEGQAETAPPRLRNTRCEAGGSCVPKLQPAVSGREGPRSYPEPKWGFCVIPSTQGTQDREGLPRVFIQHQVPPDSVGGRGAPSFRPRGSPGRWRGRLQSRRRGWGPGSGPQVGCRA